MAQMEDVDAAAPLPEMAADPDLEAAMQAPVTVMLGPSGLLLRELYSPAQSLLGAEELRLLRDALRELCIPLKSMSEDDGASFMARWWMKIVRELCYDTQDYLNFVQRARDRHDLSELPDRGKAVYSGLLDRAKDARERRKGFQWSPRTASRSDTEEARIDRLLSELLPQLPAPLGVRITAGAARPGSVEAAVDRFFSEILGQLPGSLAVRTTPGAVVVEAPNKLVELLALDDKTLKVIPILGCAGVGKTAAARTLYHKLGWKFQCRAFVSASRNPDMRGILTSMLSQLKAPRPPGFPDVLDLIGAISNHLQGKGYFIVLDDLWTASVWHIVSRAFPRGDHRSRIITTTQVHDVALACSGYHSVRIYKMELLDEYESRKVFFQRVFSSEDGCPGCPPVTKEVSYEIIRKCEGLPLAIVSIASLLASESSIVMEDWRHIHNSFSSTSEGMKDVLNLIYNSLPPGLSTCLLYLSMYPQGYVMKKDELVKHWVAEGFISAVEGRDTVEIAEGYFDELVSRAMVQAVDTNYNGEVLSCTVHHLVLDFIRSKSLEENFVTTVDYSESTLALPDKVRRLCIQFGGVKSAYIPETITTLKVRSLVFWGFFKCAPPSIMDCGFLRILILHIWADEDDDESFDLTGIAKLSLLKYLNIECNITVKLPHKIGMLRYLETLEVDARLFAVPSDIDDLERLLHLRLPSESILPQGVAHMTYLRTLENFDLSRYSTENVLQLGGLSNLQDLQLTCSMVQPAENLQKNVQLLGLIVEKLIFLQTITLVPASVSSNQDDARATPTSIIISPDGFSMVSPPPHLLRRIELSRHCCIFFSIPKWFGELRKLCILKIAIRSLSRSDIEILERMPALAALTLYNQTTPAEKMIMTEGGFQVLVYFKLVCAAPCLSFEQGAMPKLQKLSLGFNSSEWRSDTFETVGFNHLRGLTDVCVRLGVRAADNFNIKVAESAFEAVIRNDPNSPVITIKIVDVVFYGEEDESTVTREIQEGKKSRSARG